MVELKVRSIVVVHRERMVAECLATTLNGFPGLRVTAIGDTVADAEGATHAVDALALDAQLPDAEAAALRLGQRGVRVVLMGGTLPRGLPPGDTGIRVPLSSAASALALALVPECRVTPPQGQTLSPREREVLQLVSEGLAAKQVARLLGISEKTVEHHKSKIFRKLDVPNQAAAVRAGLACGLV